MFNTVKGLEIFDNYPIGKMREIYMSLAGEGVNLSFDS